MPTKTKAICPCCKQSVRNCTCLDGTVKRWGEWSPTQETEAEAYLTERRNLRVEWLWEARRSGAGL